MPYRIIPGRTTMQFLTSAEMPSLVHRAAELRGMPSNTAYMQRAICEALARDLDMDLNLLLRALPPVRNVKHVPFKNGTGNFKPIEQVR